MDRIADRHRPLDVICDDIVVRHHAPFKRELGRIHHELAAFSSSAPSPVVDRLQAVFADLAVLVDANFTKEENLLFPAFGALCLAERTGAARPPLAFTMVAHPIRAMEAEHVRIESTLDLIHELVLGACDGEALPPRWRRLLAEILTLDAALREHQRFENEILFPSALDFERCIL